MVDNFMSAGTNGDADDELPAPYGTGPKSRTTEEHHRSDYGYSEPENHSEGWRDRSTALDGLDPSPSLPNAPRSYERGPVPQQPYVPKPPFLPGPPPQEREYPQSSGGYPPQRPSYGESSRPPSYGESTQYFDDPSSSRYDESPFAPSSYPESSPFRPNPAQGQPQQGQPQQVQPTPPPQGQTQGHPTQNQPTPGQPAHGQPTQGLPIQGQAPQGPPPQAQDRPSPFGPSQNGTSGPPANGPAMNRPAAPGSNGLGPAQGPRPGGPTPGAPRPGGPAPTNHSSNGVTPHSSNGTSNGWNTPSPAQSPHQPPPNRPSSNGLTSPAPSQSGPPPSGPAQSGAAQSGQGAQSRPGPSGQGSTGWSSPAPTTGSTPPSSQSNSAANGYPSDPSAEYESNAPVSNTGSLPTQNKPVGDSPAGDRPTGDRPAGDRPVSARPVGARRRADVQQDAPSQVQPGQPEAAAAGGHRAARRAQAAAAATASASASTPAGPSASLPAGPSDSSTSAATGSSAPIAPADGSKRPRRYRIHHLRDMKNRGEKWAMLTAYDQYTAEIFDQSGIPVLLVGDSAANNVFGYESTLRVTVDELIPLARAVAGAVQHALVVADLPFGSYQASPEQAFHTSVRFMKEAGVHAVKLEGGRTVVPAVEKLTQAGIPVMAHIGFTPQSEHSIGGYRVQGRGDQAAGLIDDAVALAEAGAFSVVLEMVPGDVAAEITKRISVPTIGIGAGRDTDAQVLVWQDMAGLRSGPMPRFVKQYADLRGILTAAATTYAAEVASGTFPTDDHTF